MTSENLIIGYESALDYWRSVRAACRQPDLEPTSGKVIGAMPLTLSQKARRATATCCTEAPLQIVVPDKQHRHNCADISDRVFRGPLGARQLLGIGDCVSVCSIEVVFTQLGSTWEQLDLSLLAYELCGTYGITPANGDSFQTDLQPLTSKSALSEYAAAAKALGVVGASRALKALESVTEGSASPRESEIGLFFAAGRRLGGAGTAGFVMNPRLKAPAGYLSLGSARTIVPDFLWEEFKLIVEYDSNAYHLTPQQKDRDELRRRAFERMGYRVLTLTNDTLLDDEKLNDFVADMEAALHLRRKPLTEITKEKRSELRRRLFGRGRASATVS